VRGHPAVVLGEVAGERDDVRCQRTDAIEHAEDVVVVDPRPDVQIGELHERAAGQRLREMGDRQHALDELDPVRLDAPRVEARPGGERHGRSDALPEEAPAAAVHHSSVRTWLDATPSWRSSGGTSSTIAGGPHR